MEKKKFQGWVILFMIWKIFEFLSFRKAEIPVPIWWVRPAGAIAVEI